MIEATNLTKKFDDILAVDHINAQIREGNVFGLIGTNGAGKSTFLRMAAGVLKPDEGSITIDGMDVYENEAAKRKFFYISDDQYFFGNATPQDMMNYYRIVYPEFDVNRFDSLLKSFGLQKNRKINTFSKGMKKQVSILCAGALSAQTLRMQLPPTLTLRPAKRIRVPQRPRRLLLSPPISSTKRTANRSLT
mgnify:CR=1 FL=1